LTRRAVVGCLLASSLASASAQSAGQLTGTVRADSAPAAAAQVELRGVAVFRAVTDRMGQFTFGEVPAGRWTAVARLTGWAEDTIEIMVRAGETTYVEFTLRAGRRLASIQVLGHPDRSYGEPNATGATKFAVPLLDLPQDVAVVTRALIDDRSITEVRDLTRNVSGVTTMPNFEGSGLNEVNFVFRGVPSTSYDGGTLRDGFREFALFAARDMVSVDHVEFLKGPASVLYGAAGSTGGMANFVSRAPLAAAAGEVTLAADRFGGIRSMLDMGGPLGASGGTRYRLDAAAEHLQDFRDYSAGSAFAFAPSIAWDAGAATTVLFRAEFAQRRFRSDPYLPLIGGPSFEPLSNYYGEPGLPLDVGTGAVGQVVVTHQVNPALRLREGLSYVFGEALDHGYGDSLAGTMLFRTYGTSTDASRDLTSQTELIADFVSGGMRQRMVAGIELSAERLSHWDTGGDSLAAIAILHPVYGAVPSDTGHRSEVRTGGYQTGIYAQDLIDLGSQVKLLVGARFDLVSTNVTADVGYWKSVGDASQHGHHISPRAGVVYQPGLSTSLYASWSQSFLPNLSYPSHGDAAAFPPEIGEQFEAGIKQEFASGRLGATLAAYRITKRNLLMTDPADAPLYQRNIVAGLEQGRGIELDATGVLAPGLALLIAYAYAEARIAPNAWAPSGAQFPNQPRNRGSIWVRYSTPRGAIGGMAFGLGVTAESAQFANYADPMTFPAYAVADAMVSYQGRSFSVQLNADNLTNTRTYLGVSPIFFEPGAPFSVKTTVGYRW
jgi:iron complex outermembrane receptor protein